jgi:hypothetical protein
VLKVEQVRNRGEVCHCSFFLLAFFVGYGGCASLQETNESRVAPNGWGYVGGWG